MTSDEKVFVLSHRTGREGNTVLGAFDTWAALRRARAAHLQLFPDAKLEVLNLKINRYIFEEHIDETQAHSGNLPEPEGQAVALAPEGIKRADSRRLRGGIHAEGELPEDGSQGQRASSSLRGELIKP